MQLVIPKLQKSLNVLLRQHWTAFAKEQETFDILVWKFYRGAYAKKDNFKGQRVKIFYDLYFKDRKRRDYSNYGQKMIDDSLVKAGIIDDDNSNVVTEETVRILYDKSFPRTVVRIEEAII
jgi:Holliday junction resolvase RusA-like endonuclease